MSKEKIIQKLQEKHEGASYVYTTCMQNGCWDASCIIRSRVKNGKIVAIEPDDTINPGDVREDVGDEALKQGMIQMRACPMGHA